MERVSEIKYQYGVIEKKMEQSQEAPAGYRYFSTQRPVSIATYPNSPDNRPVEIFNYDQRIPVEGEIQAWGELIYANPLSKKDLYDYELKPSVSNQVHLQNELPETRERRETKCKNR